MKIGLLGFGTVGSGVWEILQNTKSPITLEKVLVQNLEKHKKKQYEGITFTTNPEDIFGDDTVDLVIEVVGGIDMAYEYISKALSAKKHVVTANKAVLAAHMPKLMALAEENNVRLLYEASVGGGIPLIRTLVQSGRLTSFNAFSGILNGTSNYILTKMAKEKLDFSEALKQAQDAGFAEADPSDDIDGVDVARKVAVLASTITGKYLNLEDIPVMGIRHISSMDMEMAEKDGRTIKLIGSAELNQTGYFAGVEPVMVPLNSLFASVSNEFNMVLAKGDFLREVGLYGEGAGKLATAAAVLSDVLDIEAGEFVNQKESIDFTPVQTQGISGKYYIRLHSLAGEELENYLNEKNISFVPSKESNMIYYLNEGKTLNMKVLLDDMLMRGITIFAARIL